MKKNKEKKKEGCLSFFLFSDERGYLTPTHRWSSGKAHPSWGRPGFKTFVVYILKMEKLASEPSETPNNKKEKE